MNANTDFSREVHCILGLPFDAISLTSAVQRVGTAAVNRTPCFLSTPNLNFLIASQSDSEFRQSVINSDLSVADGMPIVWIAKLLGIPIRERVAGSTLFEQLRAGSTPRLSVYFYGGMAGVAETACKQLNAKNSGVVCAGFESPGFGSIQEMSGSESLYKINASGADFLIVSLGAKKGQAWIEHNRSQISVPIISHLGAVINFVAGGLDRAPLWVQRSGFEWLWRIKEEPGLWRRYASDGLATLKLLLVRVIPYAWFIYRNKPKEQELASASFKFHDDGASIIIQLHGPWHISNLKPLRACLSSLELVDKEVQINMENVAYVDSAFIGLLLLLHGDRKKQGRRLVFCNLSKRVLQIFKYSCAEFLLEAC